MPKSRVRGISSIKKKLAMMHPTVRENLSKAVFSEATKLESEVKAEIRTSPATGRSYGSHTASSAGNAPRINTGDHINAIETRLSRVNKTNATMGIHRGKTDSKGQPLGERAYFLEMGTSRMDARPVFTPVMLKRKGRVMANLRKSIKQSLKEIKSK